MKTKNGLVRLEVFTPPSEITIGNAHADRLDTLVGKTICEIWETGIWGGDKTFPVIRDLMKEQFTETNFIPYTEFPHNPHWPHPYGIPIDEIGEVLRGKGCDAVLLGNGG